MRHLIKPLGIVHNGRAGNCLDFIIKVVATSHRSAFIVLLYRLFFPRIWQPCLGSLVAPEIHDYELSDLMVLFVYRFFSFFFRRGCPSSHCLIFSSRLAIQIVLDL